MRQALELSHYLHPERVLDMVQVSKADLLESLITVLVQDPAISDPAAIQKAIWDREHKGSTAIGHGIAIPHARCECAQDFVVAFARIKDGMDYECDDKEPIKLVFMIVASDHQDKEYIQLLSRLMLRLRNPEFIDALMNAEDPAAMFQLLRSTR